MITAASRAHVTFRISRRSSCGEIRCIRNSTQNFSVGLEVRRWLRPHAGWRDLGASSFPCDPALNCGVAPAFWNAEDTASMIILNGAIECCPRIAEAFAACQVVADHHNTMGRHLVLDGTTRRHRMLVLEAKGRSLPRYLVPSDNCLEIRLAAISSFHVPQTKTGQFPTARGLLPTHYQRHRLDKMLQLLDLAESSSNPLPTMRELAERLGLGESSQYRAVEWKSSSVRRRVQRLLLEARYFADSGYRQLLVGRLRQ